MGERDQGQNGIAGGEAHRLHAGDPIDGSPLHRGFDHFFGTVCCPTTDWLYAFIHGDRDPGARRPAWS